MCVCVSDLCSTSCKQMRITQLPRPDRQSEMCLCFFFFFFFLNNHLQSTRRFPGSATAASSGIIHDLHKAASGNGATTHTHTPTVVSRRTVAVVIRDHPLTLCLAPFKLQIVLHRRSSGPEKDHVVLFDRPGPYYLFKQVRCCSHRHQPVPHTVTHVACDSHQVMLNTLPWRIVGGGVIAFSQNTTATNGLAENNGQNIPFGKKRGTFLLLMSFYFQNSS